MGECASVGKRGKTRSCDVLYISLLKFSKFFGDGMNTEVFNFLYPLCASEKQLSAVSDTICYKI